MIEDADDEESYYKWLEENPDAGRVQDEDELEIEYDEDGKDRERANIGIRNLKEFHCCVDLSFC